MVVTLGVLGPVAAQNKDTCAASYAENQRLRKQGKLRSAREQLVVCASASCPGFIQADCAVWLTELDAQLPSIVIAATGIDGKDTAAVEVRDGGVVLATTLDGRPIPLDPGTHELELVHPGAPPQRRTLQIREGEKGRRIEVAFGEPAATVLSPAAPVAEAAPRALGISGMVLGGVGLAALGAFVGLAVSGTNEFDDLDRSCGSLAPAPDTGSCSEEQISAVKTKLTIGDVFLGVGAGLAALGATLVIVDFATAGGAPAKASLVVGPAHVLWRVTY